MAEEMGKFEKAMSDMAGKIKDLSTLDVVTFQGSVTVEGSDKEPTKFSEVMTKAKGSTDVKVKVLASTQTHIDGDIVAFYDKDITGEERQAHLELIRSGAETRKATIDFVKSVLGDLKNI